MIQESRACLTWRGRVAGEYTEEDASQSEADDKDAYYHGDDTEGIKIQILEAALEHVHKDGWTTQALSQGPSALAAYNWSCAYNMVERAVWIVEVGPFG